MRVAKALLALFAVIVVGLFAMWELAKYRLEHARFTEHLAIIAEAPGFSVSDCEKSLAEPLEQALGQVQGLEAVRTVVRAGQVVLNAEVTAIGVNARHPVELVHEALEKVVKELPEDAERPIVQRVDVNPHVQRFIASSETMTRLELSRWLDEELRRKVEVQPGVRELRLCGAVEPQLKITLDQEKLRAYGLSAQVVLELVRSSSVDLPGGRFANSPFMVRIDPHHVEDLALIDVSGTPVRLRDVARLEHSGEEGACTSARDVVVAVRVMPGSELVLPTHPSIKLTPFTPKRTAVFLSPPGMSMRQAMRALSELHRAAVITAERDELTVMFPEEPQRLAEVPDLKLRSVDDAHAVVQMSGPDFDQLQELGARARELLSTEKARWVGTVWPALAPEQVIRPERGVKGIAELMELAIGGVNVGRMEDGTPIRVHLGAGLEELTLADGRRATEVLHISQELGPAAMLRVNRQRTVELEVGLEPSEVRKMLNGLQLPQGYSVSVIAR